MYKFKSHSKLFNFKLITFPKSLIFLSKNINQTMQFNYVPFLIIIIESLKHKYHQKTSLTIKITTLINVDHFIRKNVCCWHYRCFSPLHGCYVL